MCVCVCVALADRKMKSPNAAFATEPGTVCDCAARQTSCGSWQRSPQAFSESALFLHVHIPASPVSMLVFVCLQIQLPNG